MVAGSLSPLSAVKALPTARFPPLSTIHHEMIAT